MLEQPKSKSTQPRSETCRYTLYIHNKLPSRYHIFFPYPDLPEAQEHVPHGRGPRGGLDHPDGVADRQRARQGLRLQQRPRRSGVLQQGLRTRSQEPVLPGQVSWVYRLVHQVEDKFIHFG